MKGIYILILLVYIISPLDFVPDVIPVVGWADDVVAGILAASAALSRGKK